jgi:hypothetical protein
VSALHYSHLFGRNFGEGRGIETQVRLDQQPLVERDVLERAGGEHLQENDIGVASVLDIMAGVGGNITNVIWVEVNGPGIVDREEDSHAALAGDPELPLGGVRMPVELAHTAGLDRDQAGREASGERKVAGINDADLAPFSRFGWGHRL